MQKQQKMDAVSYSLQQRGNNIKVASKVKFANTPISNNGMGVYTQTKTNLSLCLPKIVKLAKATGKPVYIVGTISSAIINGKPTKLPGHLHAKNRRPFAIVQRALRKRGIYAINPANLNTFKRALKAPRGLRCANNGPAIFNAVVAAQGGYERATNNLHRANKRFVRACCCIVIVRHKVSLTSAGVLQELGHALKYNNVPIFAL